jgi:pSer/pThr/pTyr-binding forkhead associated (FHA) protein
MLTCARCQGQSDSLARFCKYCGAPIGDKTAAVLAAPAPDPPAPPPPAASPAAGPAPLPAPEPAPVPAPKPLSPLIGSGLAPTPDTVQTRAPDRAMIARVQLEQVAVPAPKPSQPRVQEVSPAPAPPPAPSAPARPLPAPPGGLRPQKPQAAAQLIVVVEDGSDGKAFDLTGPETVIGREEGEIHLFDDPYVSPRHARLVEQGAEWRVEDLRSANGVFLRTRGRVPLQGGDLILLGSQVLQFQLVSEEERHLGPVSQHGTRVFGSKPVTRLARLDQRTTSGLVGDVYYVYRDETVLGREVGDIVFTADAFLSRRHAAVRRDPGSGRFHLEDLDSSNGTYVAIRQATVLKEGDRIRIGQHLFRFTTGGAGRSGGGGTGS